MNNKKVKANSSSKNSRSKAAKSAAADRTPSREEVARRAYEIWELRGRPAEQELIHWLQAEQELNGGS
jgi:hypothetical protein